MKLSRKLFMIILGLLFLGFLLLLSNKYLFQNQDSSFISTQSNSIILQEANNLFREGVRTSNNNLLHQAIDKYSIWLEANKKNPNKKLYAGIIRSRANIHILLNELTEAISDLKKSVQYYPVGEIQLGICLVEKKQGNLSILHDCYIKAVNIFTKKKTPIKDGNFLIARILSGDKSAIAEYKNTFQAATGDKKWSYQITAKEYFDKATYEEITK